MSNEANWSGCSADVAPGLAEVRLRWNIGATEQFGDDRMGAQSVLELQPCGSLQTGTPRRSLIGRSSGAACTTIGAEAGEGNFFATRRSGSAVREAPEVA